MSVKRKADAPWFDSLKNYKKEADYIDQPLKRLDVKAEMDHIAVFYDIFFPF
jgi:hypothetical protein